MEKISINLINETANIRKLATIAKILNIETIDGADNLELAQVRGWKVVVKKGEFKPGDLCIYCETDSLLPDGLPEILQVKHKEISKILSKSKDEIEKIKLKQELESISKQNTIPQFEFLRCSKFRIKIKEIFGQISQGICFPLSILPNDFNLTTIEENLDVTEILKIKQYVAPENISEGGDQKGDLAQIGILMSDEEIIENLKDRYERLKQFRYIKTEKLEGKSITCYLKNGEFGVTGRSIDYQKINANNQMNEYWSTVVALNIEEKMRFFSKKYNIPNFYLQGELVGTNIQSNIYKLLSKKIAFYNGYNIDTCQYFDYMEEFIVGIADMNLETVPVLDFDFTLPDTLEELLLMVDDAKTLYGNNPEQLVEGWVLIAKGNVNKLKILRSPFNRLSFKVKSRKYSIGKRD